MKSCTLLNCTALLDAPPPLEANSDISGVGVIVGFLTTAYLVLILLIVHYVFVFDPAKAGLSEDTRHVNPIDVIVLGLVSKWIVRPREEWADAFEKLVLMMSDSQIITGIALLISAFAQLRCGISAYHWQMTIYLVWFSSFTHLATLTALREYFHHNRPMRIWRLFFITALILLLAAALAPTGNSSWLPDASSDIKGPLTASELVGFPALCLFKYPVDSDNNASIVTMLFSIALLCITYTTRVVKLFEPSSRLARMVFRIKPGDTIKRHLHSLYVGLQKSTSHRWILSVPYYVILCSLLVVRSWLDILESMLWEIFWLLFAIVWGTLRLFATRNTTMEKNDSILEENYWGFGQCLALAILIIILLSALESYYDIKQRIRKPTTDSTISKDNTARQMGTISDEFQETRVSQPLLQQLDNSRDCKMSRPGLAMDNGGHEAVDGAEASEHSRTLTRSATLLSVEERSLETSTHPGPLLHTLSNEIELAHVNQHRETETAASSESQSLPPYERDYYTEQWYMQLTIFNCCQLIYGSAVVLSGAYITDASAFKGLLGSFRNVGPVLLSLINWVALYAPFSSLVITLPYVVLYTRQDHYKHRSKKCRSTLGPFDRLGLVTKTLLKALLILSAAAFSCYSLVQSLPWDLWFDGRLTPAALLLILFIVCGPWYCFAAQKLKRKS